MRLAHWLQLLAARFRRLRSGARSPAALRRYRARPLAFERLEDRMLLATLTVNSLADNTTAMDGLVTLREAILAANGDTATDLGQTGAGADQIVFASGLSGTIPLTGGQMAITDDLTITGNGALSTIIDANRLSRIFNISGATTDVTLSQLTLTKGQSNGYGGAIYSSSDGTLSISSCALTSNRAVGTDNDGGAICMANSGNLVVTGSQFANNLATDEGGAIYVAGGDIEIISSLLTGNFAGGSGGAVRGGDAVNLTGTTVSNNRSLGSGGGVYASDGGTITNSTLSGNTAGYDGGAIYSYIGALVVTNSSLTGNSAGDEGGAIYMEYGDLTITQCTISGNDANSNGGAINHDYDDGDLILISASTLSGNASGSRGGALWSYSSNVVILDSTLSGNSASDRGGAIFQFYDSLRLVNSTISGNFSGDRGGGIFVEDADFVAVNSTIVRNSALDIGGGLRLAGGAFYNSIVAQNTTYNSGADFATVHGISASHSLIGDNEGTGLTETVGTTPDMDGNYIGTTAAPIDPLLGPLQMNGGKTATHALLSGSLAIDHGQNALAETLGDDFVQYTDDANEVALASDQRGGIFLRNFGAAVDMGAFEWQPLTIANNIGFFSGSTGNDAISITLATRSILIQGVTYVLPTDINSFAINGLAGMDTLTLHGTVAAEVVRLLAMELSLDGSGTGITGAASSVESITYYGNGGGDAVLLYDSAGNDAFSVTPTQAMMTGAGFSNVAVGVFNVTGVANRGGNDSAVLFGTASVDQFVGGPSSASLTGSGYQFQVQLFDFVAAYSQGGSDTALLNDSSGKDYFVHAPGNSVLYGTGFSNQVIGFGSVTAIATSGIDLAKLRDSAGNDTFTGRPTYATLTGGGFFARANNFDRVITTATAGNDSATFYGSTGNDGLTARPFAASMSGTGFAYDANGYDRLFAYASAGNDVAHLYGSTGSDLFIGRPEVSSMTGPGYELTAYNFDNAFGYAVAGGTDAARLFDSTGDDAFYGSGQTGLIIGLISRYRAVGFASIQLNGAAGGVNRLFRGASIVYQLTPVGTWIAG